MITPIVTDAVVIGSSKNPGQFNLNGDGTVSNILNVNTLAVNGKVGINSANGTINYGVAGQVLTSSGANAAPIWSNITGGTGGSSTGAATSSSGVSTGKTIAMAIVFGG
jgi:hypothetical protein